MVVLKTESPQNVLTKTEDFSLVLGGPFYQLLRRSRLTDNSLEMVYRRIIAFVVITWVPLLILSMTQGLAWSGRRLPFLDVIRSMNIVPFTKETIFKLGVITLLPFLPLTLTMFSLEELIDRLMKSVSNWKVGYHLMVYQFTMLEWQFRLQGING